jgi:hypothetical protein
VRRLQGDLAARSSFAAALAASPGYPSARAGLGQVALAEGRWQEAAEHLEAALAAVPGADLLHYPLAMAYRGLGDLEKAESHLARRGVVGLRPPDPQIDALAALKTGERVHRTRGRHALRIGRVDDAVAAFRRAVEANPESAETRIDLAAALAAQDNPTAAIGALREAVELAPDNPTARYNLGSCSTTGRPRRRPRPPAAGRRRGAGGRRGLSSRSPRRSSTAAPATRRWPPSAARSPPVLPRPAPASPRRGRCSPPATRGRLSPALEAAHAADPADGQVAHALARLLAGAPDPALRDGDRAVDLAERVFAAAATVAHAETLAMALAETGRCDDAAALQEQAVEGARAGGAEAEAARLGRILEHYRQQRPCRAPVATGG